jgi:enterochelin esterase-like enzyme
MALTRWPRYATSTALAAAVAAFVVVGFIGVDRYARNYWLYRGFPPPHDPAYVQTKGTLQHLRLASPALGGRVQDVYVYLPPHYADHPNRRYPVMYLLHGVPGRPLAFMLTVRMGVVEDELYARRRAQPMILVMPSGSTGTFTDKEWANGVSAGEGWATFVARDLVQTIDARYRTIAAQRGRAIAGLSEGGYGAVNIALHHPGEFRVVESWSGYERAANIRAIFGRNLELVGANTPLDQISAVAPQLKREHTYFWFYSGTSDPLHQQNQTFATRLAALHVPHKYLVLNGGHNWALWRGNATRAFIVAARRLAHA